MVLAVIIPNIAMQMSTNCLPLKRFTVLLAFLQLLTAEQYDTSPLAFQGKSSTSRCSAIFRVSRHMEVLYPRLPPASPAHSSLERCQFSTPYSLIPNLNIFCSSVEDAFILRKTSALDIYIYISSIPFIHAHVLCVLCSLSPVRLFAAHGL